MFRTSRHRKPIAAFFMLTFFFQLLYPNVSWALTSGPAQPESKSFSPAGTTDMVDLFSGDFNYNIPMLDIDGYPVNLAYQSGSGMDDEASWVGLGWNLNVGAINRQLRGLPDDMKGDIVNTDHYVKKKITVGGRVSLKTEVFGSNTGLSGSGSVTLGVFSDNYTGIGAEFGVNAGVSYNSAGSGLLTANMGAGFLSSTASGVDFTPNVSLAFNKKLTENSTVSPGISASLGYNTRGGLKDLTLGTTFKVARNGREFSRNAFGTVISLNTDPVSPQIQIPYKSSYGSFSFDIGGAAWGLFSGGGGTGYRAVREVKNRLMTNPAFGFLYADYGKDNPKALMDFIREKDNPVIPQSPNLAIPVHTPDIFSYTSQAGSGQFRLHRGGSGILFDNMAEDESNTSTLGGDLGVGAYVHGGVTLFEQSMINRTGKWTDNNSFNSRADFQLHPQRNDNPDREAVFFRKAGEKTQNIMLNGAAGQIFADNEPIAASITGNIATANVRMPGGVVPLNNISQDSKQPRKTSITYRTRSEVISSGRKLKSYPFSTSGSGSFSPAPCHQLSPVEINSSEYKNHHLAEITVTDESGKRNVYGNPVYNLDQQEYSFAIGDKNGLSFNASTNQITFLHPSNRIAHFNGIDHYFHKQTQPAYPASFLLTEILSPDYMDVTGDGVTDDDLGTAMKFNYSKVSADFQWRSPVGLDKATVNRGLLADPEDDKASFVYGKKELWYLHSIETKNKIAYFITEDRYDALGVLGVFGGINSSVKQKVLKEIRLYSKADIGQLAPAKPIKVVKLEYGYDLCQNVPNFDPANSDFPNRGKLTLKKVYFLYGNLNKGAHHPYEFEYNGDDPLSTQYGYLSTDRWGSLKPVTANPANLSTLGNDEFPYATQNSVTANALAATWNLSKIKLPTGGEIDVTYEADDYGFVQNKMAMTMEKVDAFLDNNGNVTNNLLQMRAIRFSNITLPASGTYDFNNLTSWFKNTYLAGSDYLYGKTSVNVSDNPASSAADLFDFVPVYAKVVSVVPGGGSNQLRVNLEVITDGGVSVNPIIHAAWQKMRMEYPRYAYPGFMNRVQDNDFRSGFERAVRAIINSVKNLNELKTNFNQRASRRGFAQKVDLNKSFVRISRVFGKKIGGGSRVKTIRISDRWAALSGNASTRTASYGQSYDYTTILDGQTISSGVASYEPSVGNDENPLRQPIPYVEDIKGALNNFYNFEEPIGESFFPGPSVGYSKVTVRDLDQNGNPDPGKRTGYTINEFYTARDFPVFTKAIKSQRNNRGPSGRYSLFATNSFHEQTYSQGYAIELNDMHGKPKATRVFNSKDAEISSVVYHYNSIDVNAGEKRLNNVVTVVGDNGIVRDRVTLGREVEIFTDMREQESTTIGESITFGTDGFPALFGIPFFVPHWPATANDEYKLFRSAVTVKVVQYYGILEKVEKMENGSTISTENIAYDAITGDPVVTRTQNEFDKPIYSVTLPAYWISEYRGMGGAYQNEGTVIPAFTSIDGVVTDARFVSFFQPGDELVDMQSGRKFWIIESPVNNVMAKRIVDRNGQLKTFFEKPIKIVRSGYRNMLSLPTSSVVTLNDPLIFDPASQSRRLALSLGHDLSDIKVLSTATTLYQEHWGMPQCTTCPDGYVLDGMGGCKIESNENTTKCFTFCNSTPKSVYGSLGAIIKKASSDLAPATILSRFWGGNCTNCGTGSTPAPPPPPVAGCSRADYTPNSENCSAGICGRMNRAGIWLCDSNVPGGEWVSFEKCITITQPKWYYMGYAADDALQIYIDGAPVKILAPHDNNQRYWRVDPIYLTKGKHDLKVAFRSAISVGAVAVEIYDNTYEQLTYSGLNETSINTIFSTAELLGPNKPEIQVSRNNGFDWKFPPIRGKSYDVCNLNIPMQRTINPYVTGFNGNWRSRSSYVYLVNREYDDLFNSQKRGIGLTDAGYFDSYRGYWSYNTTHSIWQVNQPIPNDWQESIRTTLFEKQGEALETKDALGRHSAANFSFREKLPAAVASNAKHREIFSETFEDVLYRTSCEASVSPCSRPEIKYKNVSDGAIGASLDRDRSHTGNYSIPLKGGIKLSTTINTKDSDTEPYLSENGNGEKIIKLDQSLYPRGFQPTPNKYVLSVWATKLNDVTVSLNGQALSNPVTSILSDGWTKYDFLFDLNNLVANAAVEIEIGGSGTTLVDDIRIHPDKSHLKAYTYDERTLRVMAELDENNFATFYEYDEEGSLVRIKKETEKGMVTVKETRSSYIKQP